jgi:hypothetical protein
LFMFFEKNIKHFCRTILFLKNTLNNKQKNDLFLSKNIPIYPTIFGHYLY